MRVHSFHTFSPSHLPEKRVSRFYETCYTFFVNVEGS